MNNGINKLITLTTAILLAFGSSCLATTAGQLIGEIPIQNGGRVKPFETFTNETLMLVYGKNQFEGKQSVDIVLSWALAPEEWSNKELFQISHHELKSQLQLDPSKSRFTVKSLYEKQDVIQKLIETLKIKVKAEQKLNPFDQAVQRLENQLSAFQGVLSGYSLTLVTSDAPNWIGAPSWNEPTKESFQKIIKFFAESLGKQAGGESLSAETEVVIKDAIHDFQKLAATAKPSSYADPQKIQTELVFNRIHPFGWAWKFYLISLAAWFIFVFTGRKFAKAVGWITLAAAFSFHIFGFILRMILTGRPPVSNMYESVVWVAFGAVAFGIWASFYLKTHWPLLASLLVSSLCMMLSDFAPLILDPSLQPLQAVLRSNLWLTVHVLTITFSYALFFLAFFLGDIGLIYYMRGEKKHLEHIQSLTRGIFLCTQVGIVLLAAGTILGGVWADYSWGRFWGWDPKEVWALVALLGYIVLYHGRMAGWIKEYGFHAGSVVLFSLVIMAWFGVNYVLGAGKHTYGFGAGGLPLVAAFVAVHLIFVAAVTTFRKTS